MQKQKGKENGLMESVFFYSRDVDDVHDMMDDIQEQTELADEISRAISEPVGFGQDIDEVTLCYLKISVNQCWLRFLHEVVIQSTY